MQLRSVRANILGAGDCLINPAWSRAAENSLVAKAKFEGAVVLYTAWGSDTVQALQKAFGKKTLYQVRRPALRQRAALQSDDSEHKQKIFRADVFSGSHLAMINHNKAGHLQKYLAPSIRSSRRSTRIRTVLDRFYMDTRVLAFNTRMIARRKRQKTMKSCYFPNGRERWRWKMPTNLYGPDRNDGP